MANFIPQAFLNGIRAASGMGMQDTRGMDQRSTDQWLGVSGNPNLVYNQPTKPMPVQTMQAPPQRFAIPQFRTGPGTLPQGAPVTMPNAPQQVRLPMMGNQRPLPPVHQAMQPSRLPTFQGGPGPQPVQGMPAQQPRRIPFVEDQFIDPRRPQNPFTQYMLR